MSSTVGPLGITSSAVPGKAVVNNSAANRKHSNGLTLCYIYLLRFAVLPSGCIIQLIIILVRSFQKADQPRLEIHMIGLLDKRNV